MTRATDHHILDFVVQNGDYQAQNWATYAVPEDFRTLRRKGQSLKQTPPVIALPHDRGRKTEYLDNPDILPILRRDLSDLLIQFAGDTLERYPVTIRGTQQPYDYVHTIGTVDAVRDDASGVVLKIPNIRVYSAVAHLALDTEMLSGHHVLRLQTLPTLLVVSQQVMTAMQDNLDLAVSQFTPCEGYKHGYV